MTEPTDSTDPETRAMLDELIDGIIEMGEDEKAFISEIEEFGVHFMDIEVLRNREGDRFLAIHRGLLMSGLSHPSMADALTSFTIELARLSDELDADLEDSKNDG